MAMRESGLTPAAATDRTPPTFDVVRRGFDTAQVLEYLKRVAERVQGLETRLQESERERDETRRERDIALEAWENSRKDPYESMSSHVTDLVRTFEEDVEKLRRDALHEADRILAEAKSGAERTYLDAQGAESEARGQAEQIIREATEEAERIRTQARQEADRIGHDLEEIHGSTLNELRIIRDHMVKSVEEIEVVLNGERDKERILVIDEAQEAASRSQETSVPGRESPYEVGQ